MSNGSRAPLRLLVVLLIAIGLAGLTATAMAGTANPAAGVAKKKTCPSGTHKVVVKRHGRKKTKCVPSTTTPTTAVLSISPATYRFPDTEHGGFPCQVGTSSCSTNDFTLTNVGVQPTGVLIVGVREVQKPAGAPLAFLVSGTCGASELAPGASCRLTVQFAPSSNAGDGQYSAELLVSASPGGDAKSEMSGAAL